jgi:uncharacterized Zn finger protein
VAVTATFTEQDLRRAAGERSFDRGLGYLDAVSELEITADEITARVWGTDEYEVVLTMGEHGVEGGCDCPYGAEGAFCKHCVAVGLTVLRHGRGLPAQRRTAADKQAVLDRWLEAQPKERLLELLRDQIHADRDLRRRLQMRAAQAEADPAGIRAGLMDLFDPSPYTDRYGFLGYREVSRYTDAAWEATSVIAALLDRDPAAAVALASAAIETVGAVLERADDSSGSIGMLLEEFSQLHAGACAAAKTDGAELAAWLAEQMLHRDFPVFDPDDYQDVLGPTGRRLLNEKITAAWRADPSGWRTKHLMENLVRASGDVDAIVAVLTADLDGTGWKYLRVATELQQVGRVQEAIAFAERGIAEATVPDVRLVDFLAERYTEAGRAHDALDVRWSWFAGHPALAAYEHLRAAAQAADAWADTRPKALAMLLEDAEKARNGTRVTRASPVLVDALLSDGDLNTAWQSAKAVGTDSQRLKLADQIRSTQPGEALTVYLDHVEALRGRTGNANYEQLAGHLLAARECHRALGTSTIFDTYLADLRRSQKGKRNLISVLDRHGL